jgi:Rod binding domain-containing protein
MIDLTGAFKSAAVAGEAKQDLEKLKKATTSLEGFMFKSLLQTMGGKDGLFSVKVPGGQIYRDMVEQTLSETLSERGALGVGKSVYDKIAPMAIQAAQARLKAATQAAKLQQQTEKQQA